MKTTICFDLDGTVLASQQGVFNAARYALNLLALPAPDDTAMRPFLGPPLTEGFSEICHVPADLIDEAVRLYREYYRGGGMFEAAIYDGIPETLRVLREHGKRCLITTSKPQVFARRILTHFGVDTLFDGIYGSELDNSRRHKADVLRYAMDEQGFAAEDAVLVGDRCYDALGAAAVGMDCVGVSYGYGDEAELTSAGMTHIVPTPQALTDYLLTL